MNTIKNGARRFVSGMSKGDVLAPVILLEAFVTGGRTHQAYKRDGFIEARERFTEESLGALFWFAGIKVFNKLGDFVGKKLLQLKYAKTAVNLNSINFDVGKDTVRDPMNNYINKVISASKKTIKNAAKTGKNIEGVEAEALRKTLTRFKFAKITASVLLANAIIGFVVPKMNQKITKMYQAGLKKLDYTHPELLKTGKEMDGFLQGSNNDKAKKDVNFTGFNMLSLTNALENNPNVQLLSTDTGIAGGRAVSARNKYERIEVLFRDISSIYFYLFCRKHLNAFLNKMEDNKQTNFLNRLKDGKPTRLDPVTVEQVNRHLMKSLGLKNSQTANISLEDFDKKVFGNKHAGIPEEFRFNNGIISLEEFKNIVNKTAENPKKAQELIETARRMSTLQPKLPSGAILTEAQVVDVYAGGLINKPSFLKAVFMQYTDKKSSNAMKFVDENDIRALKGQILDYIEDIKKYSKGKINIETIKKAGRNNFLKNTFNLGVGFAVSGYFLSTAIPKIQYWITKMKTGENKFPGICEYKK